MSTLIEAAKAILKQWDTPNWKLTEPTAKLMSDLRKAVDNYDLSKTTATTLAALEPFAKAININDGDTLSRLQDDKTVLWTASGSWTGSYDVTLGHLRNAADAFRSITCPLYAPIDDVVEMVENCALFSEPAEYAGLIDQAAFEAGQQNSIKTVAKLLRDNLPLPRAQDVSGKAEVHYAYCCFGSTKYCDCVNKNHGTSWIGSNEIGDDYIPVAPSAPSVVHTGDVAHALSTELWKMGQGHFSVDILQDALSRVLAQKLVNTGGEHYADK